MTAIPVSVAHLILDRDGVLNDESNGPVRSPAAWRWIPGSREALRWFLEQGIVVSVVTNQSAVGSGVLREDAVRRLHAAVTADVVGGSGGDLEFFVCPHLRDAGCRCRKPAPGLVESALALRGVPLDRSLLVGDAPGDLEAGRRSGVAVVLVGTGQGSVTASSEVARGVPFVEGLRALALSMGMPDRVDQSDTDRLDPELVGWFDHLELVETGARSLLPVVDTVVDEARSVISAGGRIVAFGNGGSAADAAHFVGELVGGLACDRAPIPAFALGHLPTLSSALANDGTFESALEHEVRALARHGDLIVALSTSGRSPNILSAVRAARAVGCRIVVLTGANGSELARLADVSVCVPSTDVPRIQEIHGLLLHLVAARLDREMSR